MYMESWIGNIITVLVAIGTVIITECCTNRRYLAQSRKELRLKYLSEYSEILIKLESTMLSLSREADSCLVQSNPEIRRERYSEIRDHLSNFNEQYMVTEQWVECLQNAKFIITSIEDHRKYLGNYSNRIDTILRKYLSSPDTDEANREINDVEKLTIKQIKDEQNLIMNQIVNLLG